MDVSKPSGGGAADERNALFASINMGADITKGRRADVGWSSWSSLLPGGVVEAQKRSVVSVAPPGLKHVSDNQKTHKNPGLRGQAPVRAGPKPFSPGPKPTAAPASTQQPLLELDGKKWKVVSCLAPAGLGLGLGLGLWKLLTRLLADALCRRTRREQRTW